MQSLDFFSATNAEFLERLQAQYERDPQSVPSEWKAFFAGFEAGSDGQWAKEPTSNKAPSDRSTEAVSDMVHSYRELGHCIARLDPLGHHRPPHPLLELREFGFSDSDLDRQVGSGGFLGPTDGTLRSLLASLQATYCGPIGVEYLSITDKQQ